MPEGGVRRISVFDTTLRDGEAAPGNEMSLEDKIELGLALDALGVDVIEPGFPAASSTDRDVFAELTARLDRAVASAFCRARIDDVDIALDAARAPCEVQILTVASDIHLRLKRRISRDEGIREATATVAHARSRGVGTVSIALEDATRADWVHLEQLTRACVDAGATKVLVADTTGAAIPSEIAQLVRAVRAWVSPHARVSIHCHDDMGLAVANTVAAIEAGVNEIQTTVAGIGERAGNASLEEVIAILLYKPYHYAVSTGVVVAALYPLALDLARRIELQIAPNKAIIGENAFATQAGIHQAGILRDPVTYEFVEPATFGRERHLAIGRGSGRHALKQRLRQIGMANDEASVERLYALIASSRDTSRFDDDDVLIELCKRVNAGRADHVKVSAPSVAE